MKNIGGKYLFDQGEIDWSNTEDNVFIPQDCQWEYVIGGSIYSHAPEQLVDLLNNIDRFDTLNGEFYLIAYHKGPKELYIIADHLGLEEVFYFCDEKQFIFSDDYQYVQQQIDKNNLDPLWIRSYLATKTCHNKHTLNRDIKRIQGGHYLKITKLGIEEIKYRFPEQITTQKIGFEQAITKFDILLNEAVKTRVQQNPSIGCELSGGLDSSGVTALAAKYATRMHTFSHSLLDTSELYPFVNENEYIEKVNAHIKNDNQHYSYGRDRGYLQSMFSLSDITGQPCNSRIAAVTDEILALAKNENIDCMLSGFGGDELVTSSAGSVQIDLFRRFKFRKYFTLQNQKKQFRVKRLIHIFLLAFIPQFMNLYYRYINVNGMISRFKKMPLTQNAVRKMGLMRIVYSKVNNLRMSFSKSQIQQFENPNIPNRVNATKKMARQHGIQYRFPLLDKKLMDFYISLPDEYKYQNNIGRYLYRVTIEKYLPKEIAWRNDKAGATVPNIMLRFLNDYAVLVKLLDDFKKEESTKDIFDFKKFDNLIDYAKNNANNKSYKPIHGDVLNYVSLLKFLQDRSIKIKI
ncbi:asparagine synthase-related protein [Bacteroidales bacterium]|nr:asparagine synthase-related protein [Bacteroidales bacterium]